MTKDQISLIAKQLRENFSTDQLPRIGLEELFSYYALLVLVKGQNVNNEDVHNAWMLWAIQFDPDNKSIVPYRELSMDTQELDTIFSEAIRRVAKSFH